ncbi:MAG: hypothetical protein PHV33_08415 [Elusimicrobiales bacterium]|nr:hypothetical protein [Elusimicrobiales bacterium]
MDPEMTKLLVIGAAVAAAAGVAAYFIARYLKGSITISLPRTAFNPGEQLEGACQLITRKEVRGNNLSVALVATETVRERGYNGKSRTHTHEIYRAGYILEAAKVYPPGFTANYQFKLDVPAEQASFGGDSILGQAVGLLGSLGRRITWRVEVRLDAEGVDLASSQNISVGSRGFF